VTRSAFAGLGAVHQLGHIPRRINRGAAGAAFPAVAPPADRGPDQVRQLLPGCPRALVLQLVCAIECKPLGGADEIGIDLGLKAVATCSDGTELEQASFYRDLEPKLAEAQRKRRKRQVKTIHAKVAN
jgi:hypothetical protein